MKDITKSFKVLWLRNNKAFIFLLVIIAFFSFTNNLYEIKSLEEKFIEVDFMAKNPEYLVVVNDGDKDYKYSYIELNKEGEAKLDEYRTSKERKLSKEDLIGIRNFDKELKEKNGEHIEYAKIYYIDNVINLDQNEGKIGLQLNRYSDNILAGSVLLSIILGIILVSGENISPFKEFSRSLPWKREKTYTSKFLLASMVLSLLYLINIGIFLALFRASLFGNVLVADNFAKTALYNLIKAISIFSMVLGIGQVSGNIIGQIGMLIIGFFPEIIIDGHYNNLRFLLTGKSSYSEFIAKGIRNLPGFCKVIINPFKCLGRNEIGILSFIIFGLIYFLIGFLISKYNDGSNMSKVIQVKPLEEPIKWLATLSLALVFTVIVDSFSYGERIIYTISFLLFSLIFKKVFDAIFELKIGV